MPIIAIKADTIKEPTPMYFYMPMKASYYDCDCNNTLKVSAAMRYMQQTSSEQLDSLGFSVEKLYGEDMVFLLSKMCVKVHRMPVCSELLRVGTAPTKPRGARFVREFVIDSGRGERLISAYSLWILVDPATRRIMRPSAFPYPIPFQEEALNGIVEDYAFPQTEPELSSLTKMPVRYSQIDVNLHVNNAVYADIACDMLPYDRLSRRGIDILAVGFQNEARHGEILELYTRETTAGSFHIVGRHGGGACFEALAVLK